MNVDITPGFNTAANAASSFAGGYAQGQSNAQQLALHKQQLELAQQAQMLDAERQEFMIRSKQAEYEREAQAREGEQMGLDWYAKNAGPGFKYRNEPQPGASSEQDFWHQQDDIFHQLERYKQDQYAGVRNTAMAMPAGQRAAFLKAVLPGIETDLNEEEQAVLHQKAMEAWSRSRRTGAFRTSEDDPIDDVIDDHISALASGQEDPRESLALHAQLTLQAAEQRTEQANLDTGLQFAQKNLGEMDGADAGKVNHLWNAFAAKGDYSEKALKRLQSDILEVRYRLGPPKTKIGGREVTNVWRDSHPAQIVTDPSWRMIAEAEADREVAKMLATDPWIKAKLGATGGMSKEEYLDIRERLRKSVIRGFGGQFGASDQLMEAAGYGDVKPKPEIGPDVEKRLKGAGVDPDMEIELPGSVQSRIDQLYGPTAEEIPEASAPVKDPDDDVYDEADIETNLGGGGG